MAHWINNNGVGLLDVFEMKVIEYLLERLVLILGFLLVVLPEIIIFSLIDVKDWIGDKWKITMTKGNLKKYIYPRGKYKTKFRRNIEELRAFVKENDIKLLELLKYMRRGNDKKIF